MARAWHPSASALPLTSCGIIKQLSSRSREPLRVMRHGVTQITTELYIDLRNHFHPSPPPIRLSFVFTRVVPSRRSSEALGC